MGISSIDKSCNKLNPRETLFTNEKSSDNMDVVVSGVCWLVHCSLFNLGLLPLLLLLPGPGAIFVEDIEIYAIYLVNS